ncbi:MAG: hypothetical protein DRH76_08920, partial [Deltaproteobacteria bacterium]
MFGQTNDIDMSRADELKLQSTQDIDYGLDKTGWITEGLGQSAFMLHTISESKEELILGAGAGAAVGSAFGGVGAAPGAIAGMYAGFTAGTVNETFKIESGLAFDEYIGMKDENGVPMDEGAAKVAALISGAANGLLEGIPMSKALKTIPGVEEFLTQMTRENVRNLLSIPTVRKSFSKIVINAGVVGITEAITEAFQELSTITGGNILALTQGDFETTGVEETIGRMSESGMAGFGAGIVMSSPGTAMSIANETGKLLQARKQKDSWLEMGKKSADSKTRQRLPKKFQQIIKDIQEEYGTTEEMYVDAGKLNTFFQNAGVTPEVLVKDMPVLAERLEEAAALGVDVAIPLDEFATYVAPAEGFAELAGDLRSHPEMPTFNEQQEQYDSILKEYQDIAARDDKALEASQPIYEKVKGDLLATGKYDEGQAEQMARFEQQVWTVLGERTGQDATELYTQHNITRSGEEVVEPGGDYVDPLASSIDAVREGKFPTEKEMYGETVQEFIKAMGGITDEGGEMSAMDMGGRGGLVNKKGKTLSEYVDLMRDYGFGEFDENQIVDLIRDEMGGTMLHSAMQENPEAIARSENLNALASQLEASGIDLSTT